MGDLLFIGNTLGVDLNQYVDKHLWFEKRDEIRILLANKLAERKADYWLELLQKQGIWAGKVLDYETLDQQPFVKDLQLKQTVKNSDGETLVTTRSPIQLDGEILGSTKAAPKVGEDNAVIHKEFIR